jgi:CubicO group peptidase (beta-lactamase class C family)
MWAMRKLHAILDKLHATGLYPSLQVCVRHRGEVVLHRALGRFRPIGAQERWEEATTETRYPIFSLSKSITAICMHILFERGEAHVDDPVHWYIPEFAQRGKEHITLRHILTHSAGIPMLSWKLTDDLIMDWERIIQQLCASRPLYVPGRMTGYHLLSGGYILGEVLQRITGRPLREFLSSELLEPLGFETFNYGISPAWYDRTACSERVDPLPPKPLMQMVNWIIQLDLEQALAVMNRPAIFEAVIPAGNIVGTAEEVSRFFQMLLQEGELDGKRILSPEQVRRATVEQVFTRHDFTLFLTPQRYSLGFMLGRKSSGLNFFGRNTPQAFGHLGFTRNLGWADPQRELSVGFLTSSKVTVPRNETLMIREFQNELDRAFG